MADDNKKFPPPGTRRRSAEPYRQAAPAPPPLVSEVVAQPHSEKIPDVFDELERVQIDPRALEEIRSSNRMWGTILMVFGLFLIAASFAMGLTAFSGHVYPQSVFVTLPSVGLGIFFFGLSRFRSRDIEP